MCGRRPHDGVGPTMEQDSLARHPKQSHFAKTTPDFDGHSSAENTAPNTDGSSAPPCAKPILAGRELVPMPKAAASRRSEEQRLDVERDACTQPVALESERTASICATSCAPGEQRDLRQVS